MWNSYLISNYPSRFKKLTQVTNEKNIKKLQERYGKNKYLFLLGSNAEGKAITVALEDQTLEYFMYNNICVHIYNPVTKSEISRFNTWA